MDFLYSLPVASPRDALAFIYEVGKQPSSPSSENLRIGHLSNSNVDQLFSTSFSLSDHQAPTTHEPRAAPSLSYLEMLLATKKDHKCGATSYSSSLITGESDPDELPLETRTANFHTAFGLVENVIESVICERNTPAQRYKDALCQYILGSTMEISLKNKALELSSSANTNSTDCLLSPPSPRPYYNLLAAHAHTGEETDYKKRQALLHRYERFCEDLGVVPVSSVMARIAPEIENRTFTSLAFDCGQSATMPPTFDSYNTHIGRSIAEPHTSSSILSLVTPMATLPSRTKEGTGSEPSKRKLLCPIVLPTTPQQGGRYAKYPENMDSQFLTLTNAGSGNIICPSNGITNPSRDTGNLEAIHDNIPSTSVYFNSAHSSGKDTAPWIYSHTTSQYKLTEAHCELDFTSCEGIRNPEVMVPLFQSLEGYPEVTLLSLASTGIDDECVRVLALLCEAFFANLRSLDLQNNPLITDRSCPTLRNLLQRRRTLKSVQINRSGVSNLWVRTINILSHRNAKLMK
ncbi:unnamed protein product [Phytomonas sp. Hart1]|nr:unnamed protein product [Phytomonas sp. Hart1]|eukprot:CCW66494.1 unnamed protein product [Phytomonas sp. isolate Hart1]